MDQRREGRVDAKQPVRLTVLGQQSRDQDAQMSAVLVDLSGRGVSLATVARVPVGSLVRIDINDAVLLGEVSRSRQHSPDSWLCGVNLEHSLHSLRDLSELMAAICEEPLKVVATRGKHHARRHRRD